MARQLLKGDEPTADDWQVVEHAESPDALPDGPVICPAAFWLQHRDALVRRRALVGVWLSGDEEPDALSAHLAQLPLIAVRFPAFNDGRALSLAVLLRKRLGFTGELRAIGAVHEDLIHYMHRCGIDSYLLRDGGNVDVARRAYNAMSDYYQGSVIEPLPRYRRRTAVG
jgi:uncharacterized protein (DUF934 family)